MSQTHWINYTTLSLQQADSIIENRLKDPFSLLGCQPVETDEGIKSAIRVHLDDALFISGKVQESG